MTMRRRSESGKGPCSGAHVFGFLPSRTTPPPHRLHASLACVEAGNLELLQWYNLTCNDCGGRFSNGCIDASACAASIANCTCAGADNTTTCNIADKTL